MLFGHLLPELQWDSSDHLLPSAGQRARQGPPGQPDVCAHLCPGVVQLPPPRQQSRAVPSSSHPSGAAAWERGCGTRTCPPKGQTRGWSMAKHPGAWR